MPVAPSPIHLKDYRPADYRIDTVDLRFELDPARTVVRSIMAVRRTDGVDGAPPLVLSGQDIELLAIRLDGQDLKPGDYSVGADRLAIEAPPASFTLEIDTACAPSENTALEGLYQSGGSNFVTQCEAEGFRKITYFLDRPDNQSIYKTEIIADKASNPVLLSNGNLIESGDLPGGKHRAVWSDPFPKPSYLFALVAGNFVCVEDFFTTASGREVTLRIYVEPGNEDRCDFAMESLKKAMRWDEEKFGLEYDLDIFMIVAASDFNMGAMENKGLNVFNAKYVLARPETATDADYANIEAIIAHEYLHNWTGNRVTCRDWFQLSLKEGLTVFRDQEFSADMRSPAVKRIGDVRMLRARQFPEDSGPLAHPVQPKSYIEINNFYTATVYEKGAEIIRMIHTLIGAESFRNGIDLYIERHDGEAATIEDFVAAMTDASGRDLGTFRRWYDQAGTPRVSVDSNYDADAKTYTMTVSQSSPPTPGDSDRQPFVIPMAVGLLDRTGNDLPLRLAGAESDGAATTQVLEVGKATQRFTFTDVPEPPIPSLLRGFSAPVIVDPPLDREAHAFLMAHDSDPFNRWESGQQLAVDLLLDMVAAIQSGEIPETDESFIAAMRNILTGDAADKALLAQMLTLPGEEYLGNQMREVDVDAVHAARETLRRSIATHLREPLTALYHGNAGNLPYSPDAAEAGRRRLRNTALGYLAALEEPEMTALCAVQYANADNMTDRIAALDILADLDSPERTAALADFYQTWKDDPIVTDKWLSIQAMSARPQTLDDVMHLLDHGAFSIRNPNRVRALIGAFCNSNQFRFHATDGSGYAFLADQILRLDPLNPQVAARLLAPLGPWRRFDAARQKLMKAQLQRILDIGNRLSMDVYEIASKSLA
ncbi:MAG: aminopeptidase N [Alphaproteobacteria bacterium]|nr:aminopeptidase N [Alphaproteobacteria bacterium]